MSALIVYFEHTYLERRGSVLIKIDDLCNSRRGGGEGGGFHIQGDSNQISDIGLLNMNYGLIC